MDPTDLGVAGQDSESRAFARFTHLTNAPADQARFFLEAAGGHADRAVALYYGETQILHVCVADVQYDLPVYVKDISPHRERAVLT